MLLKLPIYNSDNDNIKAIDLINKTIMNKFNMIGPFPDFTANLDN